MQEFNIDPSQLVQITDLVTKVRAGGRKTLDDLGLSPRTKTLIINLARVGADDPAHSKNIEQVKSELTDPRNVLTELEKLISNITTATQDINVDGSGKIQLYKLQMTLLEKRIEIIKDMGAVEDATKFKALVKSWFENNLPANYIEQFLIDMERLGI